MRAVKLGICAKCQIEKRVYRNETTDELLCQPCQRKFVRPAIECAVCHDVRHDVYLNKTTGRPTCSRCYKRDGQPRQECSVCGHVHIVASYDEANRPICGHCSRQGKNAKVCCICHQKRVVTTYRADDEPVCSLCYRTFVNLKPCAQCGQVKSVAKKIGPDQYLCRACVDQTKKGVCPRCGHERALTCRVDGLLCCRPCLWESRTAPCTKCTKVRPIVSRGLCGACYDSDRTGRLVQRISAIAIGTVLYNTKTKEHARVRGIRVPKNRRGQALVLSTQLEVKVDGRPTFEHIYWPAVICRSLKHPLRRALANQLDAVS